MTSESLSFPPSLEDAALDTPPPSYMPMIRIDAKPLTRSKGTLFAVYANNMNDSKNQSSTVESKTNAISHDKAEPNKELSFNEMTLVPHWEWHDGIDLQRETTINLMLQLTAPATKWKNTVSTIYVLDTLNMNDELLNVAVNCIRWACHETHPGNFFGMLVINATTEWLIPITKQSEGSRISETFVEKFKQLAAADKKSDTKQKESDAGNEKNRELIVCAAIRDAIQRYEHFFGTKSTVAKQIVFITSMSGVASNTNETLRNEINSKILHTRLLADQNEITIWALGCSPSVMHDHDSFNRDPLWSEAALGVRWTFLNHLTGGHWSSGLPVSVVTKDLTEFISKFQHIYESIQERLSCRSIRLSVSNLSSKSTESLIMKSRGGAYMESIFRASKPISIGTSKPTEPENQSCNMLCFRWPQLTVQETREFIVETTVDAPITIELKFFDGQTTHTQYQTIYAPVLQKPATGFYLRKNNEVYIKNDLLAHASQLLRRHTFANRSDDHTRMQEWVERLESQSFSVIDDPTMTRILNYVKISIEIISHARSDADTEILNAWGRYITCGALKTINCSPGSKLCQTLIALHKPSS